MSFNDSSDVRFAAYVAELIGVISDADRAAPLRDYRTGAQERGAIGRDHSPGPGRRLTPVAPAFCGPSTVVRCGRAHQGSGPGPARD
jgi:hypothetical protein